MQALGLIFLRESVFPRLARAHNIMLIHPSAFEPVLLARKANRMRKELQAGRSINAVERDVEKVGEKDGEKSSAPQPPKPSPTNSRTDAPAVPAHPQVILTKFQLKPRSPTQHILHALVRPFALFAYEPIVQLMGVYMAFVYGIFYRESRCYVRFSCQLTPRLPVYLTIIPSIFEGETYHESVGIAGLHYIAFGLGVSLASQVCRLSCASSRVSLIATAPPRSTRACSTVYTCTSRPAMTGRASPSSGYVSGLQCIVQQLVLTTPQHPWYPARYCSPRASSSLDGRRRRGYTG